MNNKICVVYTVSVKKYIDSVAIITSTFVLYLVPVWKNFMAG